MSTAAPARRRFLNWFLGTSAGALVGSILFPILAFLRPPLIAEAATAEVEAGLVNDPEFLDRGFKVVPLGSEPVIVVRLAEGEFRALAATCTHLDCIVEYRADQKVLWCNCHNGRFDLSGRNIAGPPPRPLETYQVHVVQRRPGQAGTVVVSRA
jgi:Rieske Fe-S protein